MVVDGIVKLYELADSGHSTTLTLITPGQIFGGQAVVGEGPSSFSAETLGPTRLIVWHSLEVRRLMEQMSTLACNAYDVMYGYLAEYAVRCRQMITDSVDQRLARALMRLAEQLGKETGSEILLEHAFTGQDLASYAGTTPFTASRILHRWERAGIIRRGRAVVVLNDPNALANIADSNPVEQATLRAMSSR